MMVQVSGPACYPFSSCLRPGRRCIDPSTVNMQALPQEEEAAAAAE